MGVSRAPVLPHLAGHQGAVQADGAGRRLGDPPAGARDDPVHDRVRARREAQLLRDPVPDLLLLGARRLVLLRDLDAVGVEQPGRKHPAGHEGLLPEDLRRRLARARRSCGLRAGLPDPRRADGLLRDRAEHRRRHAAGLLSARGRRRNRSRRLARGSERQVPRRALRRALPAAALVLRHADRLLDRQAPRAVADALRRESNGRRRARLPLGARRWRGAVRPPGADLGRQRPRHACRGRPLLRADGEDVRGRDLTMGRVVIRTESLSKQYRLGARLEKNPTLRDAIARRASSSLARLRPSRNGASAEDHTIWALRDVSLDIEQGDVVGIIGRNGAGKSTLLKILSHITEPTAGRARIKGRVGSLLEVGTGFHPELIGRENVYLSGSILGMRQAEIEARFDEIVAFAEVERFLDTPVKRYSSG